MIQIVFKKSKKGEEKPHTHNSDKTIDSKV